MLVWTLFEYGGLYQIIFLALFLLFPSSCSSYFNSWLYPLFFSASWYSGFALLNTSSQLEISDSLLLIAEGRFLMITGGWFDFACIYAGVLFGLAYGSKLFLARSNVTSRKLAVFKLASTVIFKPFSLKTLHILFLIISTSWGVALNAPNPSSL